MPHLEQWRATGAFAKPEQVVKALKNVQRHGRREHFAVRSLKTTGVCDSDAAIALKPPKNARLVCYRVNRYTPTLSLKLQPTGHQRAVGVADRHSDDVQIVEHDEIHMPGASPDTHPDARPWRVLRD
jgi:hypothetical protein